MIKTSCQISAPIQMQNNLSRELKQDQDKKTIVSISN